MEKRQKLLIVDDDEAIRTQMKWAFAGDYEVLLAENRETTLRIVREEGPPVITLDLGLPPRPHDPNEGLDALAEILETAPTCKVIVITGQGDREHALYAVEQGAYDFFPKPIQVDELGIVIRRALRMYELEEENRELQRRGGDERFEEMIGASESMNRVFAQIRKVATTENPVLITGETGTGKELAARAIHRLSHRREGPFAAINCGAIPANLLEAELFGHEKGSFTDAHTRRKGRIEMADGGTLFLDEVGELSVDLQVALLRFLQEGTTQRVGGREDISVDARVIAATNANLEKAIRDHRFREDLYYRLAVVTVDLPPLRDRGGDITLLARALLRKYAESSRRKLDGFTKRALDAIRSHRWPGNVRELENRIQRAVVMAEGTRITPEDLEIEPTGAAPDGRTLKDARARAERETIERALARHEGNLTRTARDLGVSRPTLYELMEKLGIERP